MFETSSKNGKRKIICNSIFSCENEEIPTKEEILTTSPTETSKKSRNFNCLISKIVEVKVRSKSNSDLYEFKTATSTRKTEEKWLEIAKNHSNGSLLTRINARVIIIVVAVIVTAVLVTQAPEFEVKWVRQLPVSIRESTREVNPLIVIPYIPSPSPILSPSLLPSLSPLPPSSSLSPSSQSLCSMTSQSIMSWSSSSTSMSPNMMSQDFTRFKNHRMKNTKNKKIIKLIFSMITVTNTCFRIQVIDTYTNFYIHVYIHCHINTCVCICICKSLSSLLIITSDVCHYLNRLPIGSSSKTFQKLESELCLNMHVDPLKGQKRFL